MRRFALALLLLASLSPTRAAAFDLVLSIANPGAFTPTQLSLLQNSLGPAEAMWENVVTGYQPGITVGTLNVPITGQASMFGLANAGPTGVVSQGGFQVATGGIMNVNLSTLESIADFPLNASIASFPGETVNVLNELIAHEVGHVLGIGTLWTRLQGGQVPYVNGSGEYRGVHGLAEYRREFNQPDAEFIPVELAGAASSANSHWDQNFRSAEGPTGDPFLEDPRVGVVDSLGRDFGLELMTAAIDPDYGAPFLSRTTIASLVDLGFTVVIPEPSSVALLAIAVFGVGRRRDG
ncbi:MAG: PEP-CTERM sorting domain-containing protein [Planctomycetota bacterium]